MYVKKLTVIQCDNVRLKNGNFLRILIYLSKSSRFIKVSCGIQFIMIALKGGMILGLLNSVSFQRLQGGIDAANKRQSILANNVANADTPNFKRSDVSFESILQQQESGIQSTLRAKISDSRHFQFGSNTIVPTSVVNTDESTSMNNNDNNVDVDREMALSAENQLRYSSYVEQVNSQISMMRAVIQGG